MPYSFTDIVNHKLFLFFALLFTVAFNISLGYNFWTLLFSLCIVLSLILHNLKLSELLFNEEGEKMANDWENQNLKNIQPLKRKEINIFKERIIATSIREENIEEFRSLQQTLNNKIKISLIE